MKNISKLIRDLDINPLEPDEWRAKMKEVEWRFMMEHRVSPSQIAAAINNNELPCTSKAVQDWLDLMAIKPYLIGLNDGK